MHAHFSEPLKLRDIAAAAQLSPFHFLRTFRAAYGITPNCYLNRKRAAAARRLLQSSDWSMTTVALQVGFGSRSNLYRHLRASSHGG
jgi:AraC family transcriptional regulator